MALILDGTNGLSDVDGSASTPAIRGTDTNTGIFFPAADTIAFAEGGAEVARFDSNGNLGIGTSSPVAKLSVDHAIALTGGGAAKPASLAYGMYLLNGVGTVITSAASTAISTGDTERMRIDSSGNLLVGTTNAAENSGVGLKLFNDATSPAYRTVMNTSVGGSSGFILFNTNATNNGYRFFVKSDGGISNFSGNNTNLSDERTKTNIELSGSYLDKICAIPVKLFNYKDESKNSQKTLGVIAQDVETVAPELVDKDGWLGELAQGEEPLKSIYTTDMMFALMKCIQEQQAIITDLKSRIETLEAK